MKKHLKNVGLLLIGFVVGVTISFAPEIQASTSKLLGGTVAKVITVKKDGEVIGEGGIINGSTYLPVRTIVNSVDGIEVGSVSPTEVNLVSDSDSDQIPTAGELAEKAKLEEEQMKREAEEMGQKYKEIRAQIREVTNKIKEVNYKINIEETSVYKSYAIYVDSYENGKSGSIPEKDYQYYKTELDRMNNEKQVAEKELPVLESQLADLESQLADLEK